jgi:hypothetical protein
VALVIINAELVLDHSCDAGAGPDVAPEPISLGPVPEKFGDQSLLDVREFRWASGTGTSAKGIGSALAGLCNPTTDGNF